MTDYNHVRNLRISNDISVEDHVDNNVINEHAENEEGVNTFASVVAEVQNSRPVRVRVAVRKSTELDQDYDS